MVVLHTHFRWLANKEELLEVNRPVHLLSSLRAFALLDRGNSVLLGARLQDSFQLIWSCINHLILTGALAISCSE